MADDFNKKPHRKIKIGKPVMKNVDRVPFNGMSTYDEDEHSYILKVL